jgi:nucleoside-diphosphate-sugar epimerase
VAPPDDQAFVKVELMDRANTQRALEGFDQIVHLAAIPDPYSDPPEVVIGENTRTTFNVFEAARTNDVQRLVRLHPIAVPNTAQLRVLSTLA